uniref:Uncharacterized protein n=1 Tax=Arundo donax TaxID=35708 RepID=A0A0A9BMF6_ARUDO
MRYGVRMLSLPLTFSLSLLVSLLIHMIREKNLSSVQG